MGITALATLASATAVVASGLVAVPSASALDDSAPIASDVRVDESALRDIDVRAALDGFRAAGRITSETSEPDGLHSHVDLGQGAEIEVVTSARSERLGGGYDSGGHYILFNQFDQHMLYNGAGFALGTAICLVPAVGPIACLAVQAIIAVAAAAVATQHGTCKHDKQLKVYFSNNHAAKGGCV